MAVVFIYTDRVCFINSGDTRIYSRKGLELKRESIDHVFGREALALGKIKKKEIINSPDRFKLTAAVGSDKCLKMYAACSALNADSFFICSDGVYKYCRKCVIRSAMKDKDPRKRVALAVIKNGAGDNFSFIAIRICKD